MKEELYLQLKSVIKSRGELVEIAKKYGQPYNVVRSIYALLIQTKEKTNRPQHQQRAGAYLQEYLKRAYAEEGEVLLSMSEHYDTQPVMMARYVLEALCVRVLGSATNQKLNSAFVSEWVKNPLSLLQLPEQAAKASKTVSKESITEAAAGADTEDVSAAQTFAANKQQTPSLPPLARDLFTPLMLTLNNFAATTAGVDDRRVIDAKGEPLEPASGTTIAATQPAPSAATTTLDIHRLICEVQICIDYDDSYGPLADLVKENIGLEYEAVLGQKLMACGVRFLPDSTLRAINLSKTPDALLVGGMGVGGVEVKWVESKALFGDPDTMKTHFADQLVPYRDRYGPGLVVYWFGFVAEAAARLTAEAPGIVVVNAFPEDARPLL